MIVSGSVINTIAIYWISIRQMNVYKTCQEYRIFEIANRTVSLENRVILSIFRIMYNVIVMMFNLNYGW
ncbi:MAG: hypothetical protein ABR927_05605 [Bacteroidales bacterium]